MGSANKTANYGLNQWQGNEYPQMDDFNADNAAIDAALKANADSTQKIIAGTTKVGATSQADSASTASSAAKLTTARTIALTGDAAASLSFDGSANVSGALTLSASGVAAGTYKSVTVDAKGRVTGGTNPTTRAGYGITDAAALSTSVAATLTAAGWTGSAAPYTQTVAVAGLGAAQNVFIGIASTATDAQRAAAASAMLGVSGQAAGSLTIIAEGIKPTVDIPVTAVLLG